MSKRLDFWKLIDMAWAECRKRFEDEDLFRHYWMNCYCREIYQYCERHKVEPACGPLWM